MTNKVCEFNKKSCEPLPTIEALKPGTIFRRKVGERLFMRIVAANGGAMSYPAGGKGYILGLDDGKVYSDTGQIAEIISTPIILTPEKA